MTNNIDLRNCDCMELLSSMEEKSVDLLLTDPPYGMSFQSGVRKEKYDKIHNDDNLDWLPEWLLAIKRVMKDDSHMYIWCSWHKVDVFKQEIEKHWKIKNLMVWAKKGGGMGDLFGGYACTHELCFFINNGRDLNGRRDTDVIDKAYRTGNVYHPTEKPVSMFRWIIEKSSKPGDLVLDCFSGSGPTAIACAETRRRFKGSEIDKEFYDVSMKRVNAAIASPTIQFE